MRTVDRLKALLPGDAAATLDLRAEDVTEVHLRAGRPIQIRGLRGEWMSEDVVERGMLSDILAALTDHSLYTREAELREGYFTLEDGCRVGVCGRLIWDGTRIAGMAGIGALCVRFSREIRGCAEELLSRILDDNGHPRSTLIASGPGMGKTTLLRELARRLSDGGRNVCIADERHELAACVDGVPTLDVGTRTDVMDGCPKALSIPRMLRACAPDVIVADEIGGEGDAAALAEAVRCGVTVIASAHAGDFVQLAQRRSLREAAWVFQIFALLGDRPGQIRAIGEGWHAVCAGPLRGGGMRAVRKCHGGDGAAQGGDAVVAAGGDPDTEDSDDSPAGARVGRAVGIGLSHL